MQAGRWDVVIETGSRFRRVLRRQGSGGPLVMGGPVTWEWFAVGTTTPAIKVVTGTLSGDGLQATLLIPEAETTAIALPPGRYEHRLTATDPVLGGPAVMVRGYVTVRDRLGSA